jgi:MFS family permease
MKDLHRQQPAFYALMLATLAAALDLSVLGPSLPGIGQAFPWKGGALSWVFSAYTLANLLTLPMAGYMAAWVGKRKLLLGGLWCLFWLHLYWPWPVAWKCSLLPGSCWAYLPPRFFLSFPPARRHSPRGKAGHHVGCTGIGIWPGAAHRAFTGLGIPGLFRLAKSVLDDRLHGIIGPGSQCEPTASR